MIGEIRAARTPFYDTAAHHIAFKNRPTLLIAQSDCSDYVVLPVSRVTRSANLDPTYDVKIDPATYPNLGLTSVSYVRTHKQTTVHAGQIGHLYGDMKTEYPDLFLDILEKREQFSSEISDQALR